MKRPWRDSVLDAIERLTRRSGGDIVTRQALIANELSTIIQETSTRGQTPDQTLSYELQQLRKAGLVEFLGGGKHRLARPLIDVEVFDGTNETLDLLIHEHRLRIGRIDTGDELALSRRRRGQERLRNLALANYSDCCALCDCHEKSLLVASHIVPWAESESARGDLGNILVLCRPHDSLFEFGYWSLNDQLRVLRHSLCTQLWTAKVLLPPAISFRTPSSYQPGREYLHSHRERHGYT